MKYNLRDEHGEIVGSFDTEAEAMDYGSHLADANPDKLYGIDSDCGPEHIDALRRLVAFLREWDTPDNNADAALLEEIITQLERQKGSR